MNLVATDIAIKFIKKRSGDIEEFDIQRIKQAILKAYEACKVFDTSDVDAIVVTAYKELEIAHDKLHTDGFLTVEMTQDIVEKTLIKFNKYEIAKAYILYREKQASIREQEHTSTIQKFDNKELSVTKADGRSESFDMDKIQKVFAYVLSGYEDVCNFEEIREQMKKYIIDGIKTSDIMSLLIKSAIDLISVENTAWQFIAGRLATLDLYKKASKNRNIDIQQIYSGDNFKELMDKYIANGLYYKDFYKYYSAQDIVKAGESIDIHRDMEYNYTTVLMFKKRYLLNPNKVINELPQEMYMAAALFLAIPEKDEDRLQVAIDIYHACSRQEISLPTPTLLNARSNFHQLSSCFKMNIGDDLRSIYHNVENIAQVSKFGGGCGVYVGHVRSKGASIRGNKGASGGIMPWLKVINDTAVAVNQLGARKGAVSVTTDIWHKDIYDYLDMQTETGDIRRKAFDIFPAVSFPNLFFQRLEENANWTLFDPKEVADLYGKRLENVYGEAFEKFYMECEQDDRLELKETVAAKDLFKHYLKTVVETGMPYAFFRDRANELNPNKHEGMVYSTQLCTEIIQNAQAAEFLSEVSEDDGTINIKYKPGDMVVCNLASINVAKVHTSEHIQKIIPIAMKLLDNVVTLNYYPCEEARRTSERYRSVGLGFLGVAEYLAVNKLSYDSQEARDTMDSLFEQYAYYTFKSSNELAQDRGAYPLFAGSEWSKGIVLGKDKQRFTDNSAMADKWSELIDNIQESGVRFAYHLSPAPNTSSSLVVGTTAGVLPIYKKYFVETNSIAPNVNVAPNLTKENFWYYKEYVNMNMNDVIDMVSTMQTWIDQAISFEWMINPMQVTPADLYAYYMKAWKSGLKTVYYVRSMSLEVESCESCSG